MNWLDHFYHGVRLTATLTFDRKWADRCRKKQAIGDWYPTTTSNHLTLNIIAVWASDGFVAEVTLGTDQACDRNDEFNTANSVLRCSQKHSQLPVTRSPYPAGKFHRYKMALKRSLGSGRELMNCGILYCWHLGRVLSRRRPGTLIWYLAPFPREPAVVWAYRCPKLFSV